MPYDWRMNPYKCLACETRVQDCRCCDTGAPTLPFVVVIDGCGTFAGRHEFDATRYRDPDTLPAGVTYPTPDPCGVFWGTITAGDGCAAGGSNWSGTIGLLSWCDGTDAAIPWHVSVWCYDTDAAEFVSQGEATVTSYECRCDGPRFAFTLPPLACCCDGTLIVTDCCPDGIPDTLTVELSGSGCADFVTTVTWNGTTRWQGTVSICGLTMSVTVTCDTLGVPGYVISVDYIAPLGGTLGVTDPIAATCSPFYASQSSIPLFFQDAIATCCGSSSGSGTLTATE